MSQTTGWVSAQDPGTVSLKSGTEASELRTRAGGGGEKRGGEERKEGWEMLGADLVFFSSSLLPSHLGWQRPEECVGEKILFV